MFREVARSKQQLTKERAEEIMKRRSHGVLACLGDNGYPYAVPLNFVYTGKTIYFHSAKAGHKIDAILREPKVSFAVVDEDTILSIEYTSLFRSAIAFGKARLVEGGEWREAFDALSDKYLSDLPLEARDKKIDGCTKAAIIGVDVEHLTGKEAIEFVEKK